jgi:hypothetical protein
MRSVASRRSPHSLGKPLFDTALSDTFARAASSASFCAHFTCAGEATTTISQEIVDRDTLMEGTLGTPTDPQTLFSRLSIVVSASFLLMDLLCL